MAYIYFICQLSETVREMNCDSLCSILARRNNISFHIIICQSSFSSIFYPCLFFYVTFHSISLSSSSLFLVASQLVCLQFHLSFLNSFSVTQEGTCKTLQVFLLYKLWPDKFCFFQLWYFSNSRTITDLQTCSLGAFLCSQCFTTSGWTSETFLSARGNTNNSFSAKIQERFSSFTLFI